MTRPADTTTLELTRALIAIDSVGANETAVANVVAPLLERAGFSVQLVEFSPGRSNLVATRGGGGDLVLSGHFDTVPFSAGAWDSHPLDAVVRDGRLYGRGSSDMKGGVAAMVLATIAHGERTPNGRGFTVAFSVGEETGCIGAAQLAEAGVLPAHPLLVIGEATSNELRLGHKGATWLDVRARGVAAHGSRPDLGVNAIDDVMSAGIAVGQLLPRAAHPYLGLPTSNLGTISGGSQTNIVADDARLSIDLRTVPGVDVAAIEAELLERMRNGSISRALDLPPVWTDERIDDAVEMAAVVASVTGRAQQIAGTTYFTDAAVLATAAGTRAFIVGPGDPDQPHSANESCDVAALEQSTELYESVLNAWERRTLG